MINLADLGEKMGADPASWSSEPPDAPVLMGVADLFGRVEGKDQELERKRVDFQSEK